MAEDKLPNIDKLDESNWPVWKLQMTAYFQVKELWGIVVGEDVAPAQLPVDPPQVTQQQQVTVVAKYNVHEA